MDYSSGYSENMNLQRMLIERSFAGCETLDTAKQMSTSNIEENLYSLFHTDPLNYDQVMEFQNKIIQKMNQR